MLVGSIFAIKQRDLKGLLAYSTVSKLGAIVAMIGLPGQNGLKAAFLGIIAHALYKSALFLVAGAIDHATGTRVIDQLGGLRRQMPILFLVTIISALSMAGIPFLLGFVAKETLLDAMLHYSEPQTILILGAVMLSSVFTAVAYGVIGYAGDGIGGLYRLIGMLILTVAAGVLTVAVREHVKAAIAYGVIVIFLIEHAPDVALVQLLVETMATVLIIIMLGRISTTTRYQIINNLWVGRHQRDFGLLRDLGISIVIGLAVSVFALIALQNRAERSSIAEWHLANTPTVNTEDVVGAIVADFRGTDTLLEIAVFTTAALGVLTLLARGRKGSGPLAPRMDNVKRLHEFDADVVEGIQDATDLSTPFTRSVSTIVLPIAILIGIAQILYGGSRPGDGFTAGVTIGLAVSLWYVVLGYHEAKRQLPWFLPALLTRLGLLIALLNAMFPIFLGRGFMGHVEFDKVLGINEIVGSFGLHINSSLIFEIAIALAVMGGLGIIMEAIAFPNEVETFGEE